MFFLFQQADECNDNVEFRRLFFIIVGIFSLCVCLFNPFFFSISTIYALVLLQIADIILIKRDLKFKLSFVSMDDNELENENFEKRIFLNISNQTKKN